MTKYFFLDVDGTLLPFGKSVPDSAVYAIKAAQALGSLFFIASGRSLAELPRFERIEFDGLVCSAGATVVVEGKKIADDYLPQNEFKMLNEYLASHGLYTLIQAEEGTYMSAKATEIFKEYLIKYVGRLVDLNGLIVSETLPENVRVKKLLFISEESGWGVENVRRDISSSFSVVNNTVGLPENLMAEIVRSDISKATGIEKILSYYGADKKDAVAIGDGSNDIEMVEYAGLGIAMGNASADLKSRADWITGDVEQDGLKEAIMYALRSWL